MKVFYALWIPILKKCDLKAKDCNDCLCVKDIPNAPAYYFWGNVHPNTLDFILSYTTTGNRKDCKDAEFRCEENTRDGFIIYSLDITESDKCDDLLLEDLTVQMHHSIYHFIKSFFHTHIHHEKNADALLQGYFSDVPISFRNATDKYRIANHYLSIYDEKIACYYNDIHDEHDRAKSLVMGPWWTIGKGVRMYSKILIHGREALGEYGYCEFLMQQFPTNRRVQNQQTREYAKKLKEELENVTFEHNINTNNYSIKLGVGGILIGIGGVLISTFSVFQGYFSQTPKETEQLQDTISVTIQHQEQVHSK